MFHFLWTHAGMGQRWESVVDSLRAEGKIPGLGYAVLRSDTILELKTLGVKRADKTDRLEVGSRFHLGSNTKAVTSFIAAQLVEAGKIQWSTRFFELFPELSRTAHPDYHPVTLGQLLSHRAGVAPCTSGVELLKLDLKGRYQEKQLQFAEALLKEAPQKPKEENDFFYSNAGYGLASMMLEKTAGMTFEELVENYVNKKLGVQFKIGWPHLADSLQTYGHMGQSWGRKKLIPYTDNFYKIHEVIQAAGDLNATLSDYAKFVQIFLKGMRGENSYLRSETITYLLFGLPDYAFGWLHGRDGDDDFAAHDGSAGTFYCHTSLLKNKNLGLIIVSNSAEKEAQKAIYQIRKTLLKKYNDF
ncbi:MAG: beta-lactamase family protein [Flavobacteriales bacterium]|nr:beta-lactamase family protein [Flavobacteriales bacterium]MDW8433104.1 serine hydrolase domain-containing protein [Flavobacteriales bacterium]